jgi:hypothetical protein
MFNPWMVTDAAPDQTAMNVYRLVPKHDCMGRQSRGRMSGGLSTARVG